MQMFRRFKADQSGATAMLFGFAALPLVGMAGAAIDYSRAANHQSRMQLAVDATALAIVRSPSTATQQEIQRKGEQYLASTLRSDPTVSLTSTSIKREGNVVKVAAAATMNTSLIQVLGIKTMPISTYSQATWSSDETKIEVALVLDNTGSMSQTIGGKQKIEELQKATKDLLGGLQANAKKQDSVKVSIVPFDTEVRLDPNQNRYKSWLSGLSTTERAAWTGYVIDRHGSYATSDETPVSSITKSLYPALPKSEYRTGTEMGKISTGDLPVIRPLTSIRGLAEYNDLVATVDAMKPRGYTNIALGVTWGMATLSQSEPFTEGVAAGTSGVEKYMIVLTDGDNTANHVDGDLYNADCKACSTGKGKTLSDAQIRQQINDKTTAACDDAKKAGVKVFTVRLLKGNVGLLQGCASPGGNYFDVQNAGDLSKAFKAILDAMTSPRLTH